MSSEKVRGTRWGLFFAVQAAAAVTLMTAVFAVMIDTSDWPRTPCLIGIAFTAVSWQGVFKIIGNEKLTRRMKKLHCETRAEFKKEVQKLMVKEARANIWAEAFAQNEANQLHPRLRPVDN